MTRARKFVLFASGIAAGALIVPPGVAAAKEAIQEVFVANTVDDPVPVAGTVTVQEDGVPFEVRVDLSLSSGESFDSASFQVPAGQRLVVEFVSARVVLPDGQTPLAGANTLNAGLGFAIPLESLGVGNGNRFFAGSSPVLDFASAGSYTVNVERQLPAGGTPSGTASAFFYVSGYLLPA